MKIPKGALSLDINKVMSDVNKEYAVTQKKKDALTKKARKGLVPLVIYSRPYGKNFFRAVVWNRLFGVSQYKEHKTGVQRYVVGSCCLRTDCLRFDNTGEVARQLWEFEKQRRKIHRAEQRFLKNAFLLGTRKIPELEEVKK